MKIHFLLSLVLSILVFVSFVSAETYVASVKIVGVDKEGRGIVGNITVEIQPGRGRILVDTQPLQGIYTQNSERTAVKVAKDITKFDFSNYDVIYTIYTEGATNVEGPSAGGAMTIATIAAIQGKTVSPAFSMTGTIEDDHSIGKVGEILAKAKAAADSGVTVFLIPEGQGTQMQYVRKVRTPSPGWRIETIEPVPINVIEYAKENLNMNIYEVKNIEEALRYAFQDIPLSTNITPQNIELPPPSSFISPVKAYSDFEFFARSAISRAEANYQKAKNKMSSTILPDDVNGGLDILLKNSKDLLDDANKLIDSGYKYSAGNNAFKSSIYSQTIIDLANYYSSPANTRSLVIENKLNQLKGDLAAAKDYVEKRVEGYMCDPNNFEWSVFAIQRITYAENRINEISIEDPGNAFFDMNVANEWIKIAREFANKFSVIEGNTSCISDFETKARILIDEAENNINTAESLGAESVSNAKPYLQAAKKEYERGWYVAAMFDATTAKARASVSSEFEDASLEQLYEAFNKTHVVPSGLISTIFYEHSVYTMYLAIKENSRDDGVESLQILQTSKDTEEVYKYVNNRLSGLPTFPVLKWRIDNAILNQLILFVLVSLLVFLTLYSINLRNRVKQIEDSMEKNKIKMNEIEKEIKKNIEKDLKSRLKRKEINKKQYEILKKRFNRITISK